MLIKVAGHKILCMCVYVLMGVCIQIDSKEVHQNILAVCVLVNSDIIRRHHKVSGFKTQIGSLTVLESGSLKSRCWQS